MATKRNKPRRSSGLKAVKPATSASKWMFDEVEDLLKALGNSFVWWIGAEYREHEDEIVGDASPQAGLRRRLRRVINRWQARLEDEAARIAEGYVKRVDGHVIKSFETASKAASFAIPLTNTRKVNTVYQALVEENARLIRNLSEEFISKAEGVVWRSVSEGADLQALRDGLIYEVGIERRRAERIAEDQAGKASNALANVRAQAAGLIFGVWEHNTGGSKTYRDGVPLQNGKPTEDHIALDGEIFILERGLIDIQGGTEEIKPGQRPFCKCTFRVILPGTDLYAKALEKYPEYAEAA